MKPHCTTNKALLSIYLILTLLSIVLTGLIKFRENNYFNKECFIIDNRECNTTHRVVVGWSCDPTCKNGTVSIDLVVCDSTCCSRELARNVSFECVFIAETHKVVEVDHETDIIANSWITIWFLSGFACLSGIVYAIWLYFEHKLQLRNEIVML